MSRSPRLSVKDLPPELREAARALRRQEAEDLQRRFRLHCRNVGLPRPEAEYRFAPPRRWRMDFAWPGHRVYLEMQGGVWIQGGHTRGSGFVKDMERNNAAAALGWRLLQVQPEHLFTAETAALIARALDVARP